MTPLTPIVPAAQVAEGEPGLESPTFLTAVSAVSPGNELHFVDSVNRIRRLDGAGRLRTVAGSGVRGLEVVEGPARGAALPSLVQIRFSPAGVLHFVPGGRVWKVEGERIVGYVQARTQPTRWGLTEYVWALDAKLALLDFRVQRSREPGADRLARSQLAAGLRGLSLDEVRRRWSAEWLKGLQSRPGLAGIDGTLVEGAVAAGLKTIWLTQEIWQVNRRSGAPASL